MNVVRVLLLAVAPLWACSLASCFASDGTDTPSDVSAKPLGIEPAAGYKLVKEWNFKTDIRDSQRLRKEFYTRYIYGNGSLDHLNDEWSRYRDNENHVFTANGLSLVARAPKELAAGKVESGMLRTRWTGKYGVYEAKMKVPAGRGLWPAFWLNPQDATWPPEIDIVEIVNNGKDTSKQSFHFLHGKATKEKMRLSRLDANKRYTPGIDYSDDFHIFSVEWTEDSVKHYVDGVLVVDRQYYWVHENGKDAGDAHILLNLGVGGNWPGAPDATSLPASLEIEYVRVFQK